MALTAAQQTDAYRFFSIAFNAAPGVEYMNQIADAYATGATTKDVVNAFVSKSQFTNVYPTFLTNVAFANNLVENIVGSSAADAAKTQAKADIVTALNGGLSRGDVIYTIFNNLANKPAADADWGNTAKMMANKVAVAQYYTEVLLGNTTNLATLQSVLSNVTPATDVSTPAAIQAVLGDVFNAQGQTFALTTNADQVPGMLGSAGTISTTGNDVYVATNTTLSSADRLVDAAGTADKLKYSSQAAAAHAAFEMKGVETLEVTADQGNAVSFDLSGSEGLTLLKTLNSTGNVSYTQVTSEADIEVNNVTQGANVTVSYQDSVVAGSANDVTLTLANNSNVTPVGTILVGRTAAANAGVETISAVVSGAASTVTQLNSDISTLNVAGNQNLTITTALNSTVDTVAAGSFTGALNINLTGNVLGRGALPAAPGVANTDGVLSITTGTGNDVIDLLSGNNRGTAAEATDLATVTRNATISTGAGNDYVEAGLGDDNINLGEGNDTLVMTAGGLTVADLVTGGAGADQLTLNTTDSISKSEAERVTQIETVNLLASGSTFVVTDNLLTTADGGMFTINTNNPTFDVTSGLQNGQLTTGGHTIDLTNVSFNHTGNFTLSGNGVVAGNALPWGGQAGTGDTVIANDATVNAKATLTFGQDGDNLTVGRPANTYTGDTLRIVDGGDYRFDDFVNVTGLDVIELTANTNIAQTYNLELLSTIIDSRDSTAAAGGDNIDDLVVKVSRNVPQGSVVNIDAAQISATQRVTVYTNSNVTVNVTNNGAGRLVVVSSLEFTENSDNLVGSGTFSADSLDQLDTADYVSATGIADVLQLNFAVQNPAADLDVQFNLFGEDAANRLEIVTFNTNNNVSFRNIGTVGGADNTLDGVTTVNFGAGNDSVTGNTRAATFNFGNGNNSFADVAGATIGAERITSGTGNDTFTFNADTTTNGTQLDGTDSIASGAGTDTLNINDGAVAGALFALPNVITGVDAINYTVGHVGDGLVVDNVDVNVADDGETDFTVTDNTGANTVAIFNASALTATPGHLNTARVVVNGAGAGLAANAVDVFGGADNDVITIGGTLTGYVVQGNGGADTINIVTANATGVLFNSPNDGGATGANTGYDTITGFTSGTDFVLFNNAGYLATDTVGTGAAANLALATDAPANFTAAVNALVMTQAGSGFTDADLLDLAVIASRANTIGVTAAATQGGLFIAQGATQSAVYLYVESNGTANNVGTNELKLLGIVDSNALGNAATDLQYM